MPMQTPQLLLPKLLCNPDSHTERAGSAPATWRKRLRGFCLLRLPDQCVTPDPVVPHPQLPSDPPQLPAQG